MRPDAALAKAEAWVAAWNGRDLDAVLAHYSDEIELISPLVVERLGRADGTLRGKAELRAYFARGMGNPALHFTLGDVRLGVNAICILYTREGGKRCADTMQLDPQGLCRRMIACYAP
jgi:ketosteroid isomerase-like protein